MAIDILDFAREVDANRKKLIKHARANNVEVDDNISLSAITEINTQFGKTESDNFEFEVPEYIEMPDPAREGPFNIVWVDYDGTELFKETVNKGEAATQFTGEPLLHKQFPDILEWDDWEYNGSLDSVYRDVIVTPKYNIKKYSFNDTEYGCNYLIVDIDVEKESTFSLKQNCSYSGTSNTYSTNCIIDWGDGSGLHQHVGAYTVTHTYAQSGTYIIKFFSDYTSQYPLYLYFSNWQALSKYVKYAFFETCGTSGAEMLDYCSNLKILINNNTAASYNLEYNSPIKVLRQKSGLSTSQYAYLNNDLEYLIQTPSGETSQSFYLWVTALKLKAISIAETCTSVNITKGYRYGSSSSDSNYVYCNNLEYIYIPDSVISLKIYSSNLKHITVPKNVTALLLQCNKNLGYINFIDDSTSKPLTLDSYCFSYNYNLKYVKLPNKLNALSTYAFYYCTNLKYVLLPEHITTIPDYCFSYCNSLYYVNTNNIESINSYSFQSTNCLKYLNLENTRVINNKAFAYSGIKKPLFSNKLVTLNGGVFYDCNELDTIYLGNVSSILADCFFRCYSLKNIVFPSTVEIIESNAFRECDGLCLIDLQNTGVTSLTSTFTKYILNRTKCTIKLPPCLKTIKSCFNNMLVANNDIFDNLTNLIECTNSFTSNTFDTVTFNNTDDLLLSSLYAYNYNFNNHITLSGTIGNSCILSFKYPENSTINTSSNSFGGVYKLDMSNCNITVAQTFTHMCNLKELILPDDYPFSISLYQTCLLGDNLLNVINKLATVATATLTINNQQKAYLSDEKIEELTTKGWTIAISSKSYS